MILFYHFFRQINLKKYDVRAGISSPSKKTAAAADQVTSATNICSVTPFFVVIFDTLTVNYFCCHATHF